MALFSGEYECKIDDKGRMVLPSKIKSLLPADSHGSIIISRGFEPCLVVYPKSEWQNVFEKVSSLNEFNAEYRSFQRNFLRGNTEVDLDKLGRFLVPKTMLAYVNLSKEAILVGIGNRIEIWESSTYDKFLIKDREQFSQLAEKFLGDKINNDDKIS